MGGWCETNIFMLLSMDTMAGSVHVSFEMWNKEQSTSPNPAAGSNPQMPSTAAVRPAASPAAGSVSAHGTTVIGETMRIKGDVHSDEELRLDGEVEGRMELRNRLTIGPKGKAQAHIVATEVDISGTVQGNVNASERIFLRKGANLVGDVKTSGIVIEDGAYFKGGIDIAHPEAQAAAGSRR
jgi:cytoskeletal protein CcmA (bactofilin family)